MNRPHTIDFVITTLNLGGAETQVALLARQLQERGYAVRVISLLTPGIVGARLTELGIPVASLHMDAIRDFPRALYRLYRLLKARRADLVHAHMVHANLITRLCHLLLPGMALICTAHNLREGGKSRDLAYRLTSCLSDFNTTISAAATRRYVSSKIFPEARTQTIYNGIDVAQFHPAGSRLNSTEFTWLAVGRLHPQKDYPTLLRAFSQLRHGQLLIAGIGELEHTLHALSSELGIVHRVHFLGLRTDIADLYRCADGFVLASHYEGYGLVVAEAMASGLPVVVTDSGGPGEIVGHSTDQIADATTRVGYLVPTGDAGKLAAAMTSVMAMSAAERAAMGARARARILSCFAIDQIVQEWIALYDRVYRSRRAQ